jgi:hypothetical protein
MSAGESPRTTDDDYIRRVLRYRPSSLIPWVANVGAQYSEIGPGKTATI